MVWNSIFLMTVIDISIVAVVGYAIFAIFRQLRMRISLEFRNSLILMSIALGSIAVFYVVDLYAMHVLPRFITKTDALDFMSQLHLEYQWWGALVIVGCLTAAFIISARGMNRIIESLANSEEAPSQSDTRLSAIVNAEFAGLLYFDDDQRFRFVSQNYRSLVTLNSDDLIGKTLAEALGEAAYETAGKYARRALAGETVSFENTLPSLGGGPISTLVSYVPDFGPDNSVKGFYALVQNVTERKRLETTLVSANEDLEQRVAARTIALQEAKDNLEIEITERKLVEQALRSSETQKVQLLESTKAIPWEADAKTWMFTYVGPQAETLLGYPRNMWLEKSFWADHVHPADREWVMEYCEKSSNQLQHYEFEYRMIDNADQVVWVHDIVNVISENGEPATLQGFMIDITERRIADQTIKDSELRYRTIIEGTLDAVLVTDTDGIIKFTNSAAVDLFAANSMDQMIGVNMMTLIHPKDHKDVERRRDQVLEGLSPPFSERTRLRLDGSEFLSESRGVPIPWEGEPAILIVVRDITHRKRTEEILQNLSARLISAHEDERARIARELHDDFSQSLAILTIDMELYQQGLSDSQKSIADFLAVKVQVTKDLSSKLQLLSRQLHPSIIDHIGLVSAISSYCNELSDRPDFRVNFSHEGVQHTLPNDTSLCLFRIVQEGLRNVIKHSGAATASVELNGTPDELTLRISDLGRGFDPKSDEVRRGLGLLSMRERLRGVDGEISFSQLQPSGTQIEVRVPLARGK